MRPMTTVLALAASSLMACGDSSSPSSDTADTSPTDTVEVTDTEDAADAVADTTPETISPIQIVTLLHTAEERGYLAPRTESEAAIRVVRGGAANMAGWWAEREHVSADTHLVLTGGSSWIGAPAATWLRGESVVEVMGLMGYDVATLGSRDYDFGRATLLERIDEADYPFVSANTRLRDGGALATFVASRVSVRVGAVDVAVIGLMDPDSDTNPADIADLDFMTIATLPALLDDEVRAARAEGAELVVLLSSAAVGVVEDVIEAMEEPIAVAFAAQSGGT